MVDYIPDQQIAEHVLNEEFVIKTYNLTKIYNQGLPSQVRALDNVSFGIKKGRFIAIAGPSGSGKSTLLNILGCMDSTTTGRVLLDETEITKLSEADLSEIRRTKIGFVFQDFLLIPTLSAIDNVLLPLIPEGIKKEDRIRAKEILEKVGLGDRLSHKPKELSGGEKQRVAIARALINSPKIIFADEPTGNLDTTTGEGIIALLRELNRTMGLTVVIVTHDPMIMEKVDLVLNMKDGGIHVP